MRSSRSCRIACSHLFYSFSRSVSFIARKARRSIAAGAQAASAASETAAPRRIRERKQRRSGKAAPRAAACDAGMLRRAGRIWPIPVPKSKGGFHDKLCDRLHHGLGRRRRSSASRLLIEAPDGSPWCRHGEPKAAGRSPGNKRSRRAARALGARARIGAAKGMRARSLGAAEGNKRSRRGSAGSSCAGGARAHSKAAIHEVR